MTEKEIKDLAREVAEHLYNEDKSVVLWWCNEPKERKAEEMELVLQFLSSRYCLVEKELVMSEYDKVKTFRFGDYYRGRYELLELLFGKELFNE